MAQLEMWRSAQRSPVDWRQLHFGYYYEPTGKGIKILWEYSFIELTIHAAPMCVVRGVAIHERPLYEPYIREAGPRFQCLDKVPVLREETRWSNWNRSASNISRFWGIWSSSRGSWWEGTSTLQTRPAGVSPKPLTKQPGYTSRFLHLLHVSVYFEE